MFKKTDFEGSDKPEYIFDWVRVKEIHKSFIDAIVIEICFPGSPIPGTILLHILREATEESPRDAKCFPQVMWDSVGNFSVRATLSDVSACCSRSCSKP